MTLSQLVKKLREIKAMGFIQTVRAHQGGVGNTLESLLNIRENNLRLPDVGEIELKAKRVGSLSMLTLASKAPQKRGVNRILFENYKYYDPKEKIYKLYTTVPGSKANNRGFRIRVEEGQLVLENPKNIEAFWPLVELDDVLKKGTNKIMLVLAETKGEFASPTEQFNYTEAYLLDGIDYLGLKNAINNNKLKVDIRIGVDKSGKMAGKYHDHGTGFRIFKRDYLGLFKNVTRLI